MPAALQEQHQQQCHQQQADATFNEAAIRWPVHPNVLLCPVLHFLFMAFALLPLHFILGQGSVVGEDSPKEHFWATVIRALWVAWLIHAAGLMDEMMRVFLGIQLTIGLGTPASVDKVYTKMSRRAEVVAEVRVI